MPNVDSSLGISGPFMMSDAHEIQSLTPPKVPPSDTETIE